MKYQNNMPKFIRSHWPLLVCLVVFLGVAGLVLRSMLFQTAGHLIYPLDDTYIHMAMAKNIAGHGVYGVTPYEFSSSSSSPLWTLLLASFFMIFGVQDAIPLVLNLVFSSIILVLAYKFLNSMGMKRVAILLPLLAILFVTPLWTISVSGMEHVFHILLVLLYVTFVTAMMTRENTHHPGSDYWKCIILTAALVLTRYESYALIVSAGIFLLARRRRMLALTLALAAILPLLFYQAISVAHGWFWLPNSIFIRTSVGFSGFSGGTVSPGAPASVFHSIDHYLRVLGRNLTDGLHITLLVCSSACLIALSLFRTRTFWKPQYVLAGMFIFTALSHLIFGRIGYFFRYEAYLVVMGILTLAALLPECWKSLTQGSMTSGKRFLSVCFIILCICTPAVPLIGRMWDAFVQTPVASRNIYEQQYQMGTFFRENYPTATIAVNDIGAVSYLSNSHLVDLVGLGSVDILRLRREGNFTTEGIGRTCEAHGVSVAILYDSWFQRDQMHGVPASWIRAGQWRIRDNVICGDDIVSIYAVRPEELNQLLHNLRNFSSSMPAGVEQIGMYRTGTALKEER